PVYALAWSNSSPSSSSSSSSSLSPYASQSRSSGSSRYIPSSPSPLSRSQDRSDHLSSSYQSSPSTSSSPFRLPDSARLAIGSFVEQYTNRIQILGFNQDDPNSLSLLADASHPYPPTKLGFQPSTLSEPSSYHHQHHLGSGASGGNRMSSSDRERERNDRGYASPTTKLAKRGSWGAKARTNAAAADDADHLSSSSSGLGYDNYPDRELLASTADCLRIWEVYRNPTDASAADGGGEDARSNFVGSSSNGGRLRFGLREKSVLAHSKNTNSPPAPLTSFSWNTPSPNLVVTSSIDTTCTIWDLPTRTALTQLIAHDREVYDVDWCPGSADVFASVGADGSVRVFDLRSLEHSTIIYETGTSPGATESRPGTSLSSASSSRAAASARNSMPAAPLLRIAFNPWDANYLATFHLESDSVQILDVRAPGSPILELRGHSAAVNAVAWGPPGNGSLGLGPSKGMICTAADDAQCLVYDLASTTLRTASAQGRRSRNGHAASPSTSGMGGGGGPSGVGGAGMGLSSYNHSSSSMGGGTNSPGPSSMGSVVGIGSEIPILAYTTPNGEMVNNVAWLRPSSSSPSVGGGGGGGGSRSVVQEWNEYTSSSNSIPGGGGGGGGHQQLDSSDWLALAAGNSVRALRV
ncbi:WD40 repeat-like protein, partial [Violaceomyces palustris]